MAGYAQSSSLQSSKSYSRLRPHSHGQRDVHRKPRSPSPRSTASSRPSPPYSSRQLQPHHHATPVTSPSSPPTSHYMPNKHGNGITMERTPSGNSILSDSPYEQDLFNTFSDETAVRRVKDCFGHVLDKRKRLKHEQILRRLIKIDDPLDSGIIDDEHLLSIVTTCDSIFFGGALAGRVQWEWSSQERYQKGLIGTTAFRKCVNRNGYETLIVLSEPILKSPNYDRHLLLSTFLHELVHCYLFIQCGPGARKDGGHTNGFRAICKIIGGWVGGGYLSLCNSNTNPRHFLKDVPLQASDYIPDMYREDLCYRYEHHSHNPRPGRYYREETGVPISPTFELHLGDWSSDARPPPYGVPQFY